IPERSSPTDGEPLEHGIITSVTHGAMSANPKEDDWRVRCCCSRFHFADCLAVACFHFASGALSF
ncbi:hypothetical protein Ancab_007443, partial [Ancistrocladus abbreviatus]